jgi:hypothetical protein
VLAAGFVQAGAVVLLSKTLLHAYSKSTLVGPESKRGECCAWQCWAVDLLGPSWCVATTTTKVGINLKHGEDKPAGQGAEDYMRRHTSSGPTSSSPRSIAHFQASLATPSSKNAYNLLLYAALCERALRLPKTSCEVAEYHLPTARTCLT